MSHLPRVLIEHEATRKTSQERSYTEFCRRSVADRHARSSYESTECIPVDVVVQFFPIELQGSKECVQEALFVPIENDETNLFQV